MHEHAGHATKCGAKPVLKIWDTQSIVNHYGDYGEEQSIGKIIQEYLILICGKLFNWLQTQILMITINHIYGWSNHNAMLKI